jgi:hypothetical protein
MTMSESTRFPLAWPDGWPRTPDYRRSRSRYEKAFARDRDEVLRRLKRMGATTPIISTNVALRLDGLPLANQRAPKDPGVAVYFDRKRKPHVIACDAWQSVDENLRACLRTLEALAAIERSGSAQLEDRAYAGFARLPAAVGKSPTWRDVLGNHQLLSHAESAYREMARSAHPDRGGSHEAMAELNAAIAGAREELR